MADASHRLSVTVTNASSIEDEDEQDIVPNKRPDASDTLPVEDIVSEGGEDVSEATTPAGDLRPIPTLRVQRPSLTNEQDGALSDPGPGRESGSEDEFAHEEVDPRVQGVLEDMTDAMDQVNKAENLLTTAKKVYKDSIVNGTQRLQSVLRRKNVRAAVDKTESYYSALQSLKRGREEAARLAAQYDDAQRELEKAREEELECEQRLLQELRENNVLVASLDHVGPDPVMLTDMTQDAINEATNKVNECKREIERIGRRSRSVTQKVMSTQERFMHLEEKARYDPLFATLIDLAQEYYDTKYAVERDIAQSQRLVDELTICIVAARDKYKTATNNITNLSLEIHSARNSPSASRSLSSSIDDLRDATNTNSKLTPKMDRRGQSLSDHKT